MSEFERILRKLNENLNLTDAEWESRDAEVRATLERESREERNEAWQQRKARLIEHGLGERHMAEIFAGAPRGTPAIKRLEDIPEGSVAVMSGNVGCGKTLAAHVWLLDALNVPPLEWKSNGIRLITASWFARKSRYEESKFVHCQSAKKLVIDDLGVEYADDKKSFLVDLDELLDMRWRNGQPTLITTNLVLGDFQERYGRRIYDRVKGEGHWLNVKHESMRE